MQNYPQGLVRGPGTGTSDSIVARVSNGEYILPKAAVDMIGKQKLNKLKNAANALHPLPRFAMGGLLDEPNRQISVNSGMAGQENDMSTANSMNRAADIMKSMRTPDPVQQPTQDQKMQDAFKTFSSMFSGGGDETATPSTSSVAQKPDFMGISQKEKLPKFEDGGLVGEEKPGVWQRFLNFREENKAARIAANKQNMMGVRPQDTSYDKAPGLGIAQAANNFVEKRRAMNAAEQKGEAYVAPAPPPSEAQDAARRSPSYRSALSPPTLGTVDKVAAPSELQVAGPGEIVQPKGARQAQYDGVVTTTGSKATGFMPGGKERFVTDYSVRGANGGTGELRIEGPSQRQGGGTVSIMNQGNGGTVEGNVAALNRQTAAWTSLREAQNPGITTGTGRFGPSQEAPSTDPFGGDREKRAKYESLVNEAANEKGWGGSKRAAHKMAAAEAMLAPGSEEAKLRAGMHGKQMDNATEEKRNAAAAQAAAGQTAAQAAEHARQQGNWEQNHALQVGQAILGEKDKILSNDRAATESDRKSAEMANKSYSAPIDSYMEQFKKKDGGYSRDRASVIKGLGNVFKSGRMNKSGADYTSAFNKGDYIPPQIFDAALAEYEDFLSNGEKPYFGDNETPEQYFQRKTKKETEAAK